MYVCILIARNALSSVKCSYKLLARCTTAFYALLLPRCMPQTNSCAKLKQQQKFKSLKCFSMQTDMGRGIKCIPATTHFYKFFSSPSLLLCYLRRPLKAETFCNKTAMQHASFTAFFFLLPSNTTISFATTLHFVFSFSLTYSYIMRVLVSPYVCSK